MLERWAGDPLRQLLGAVWAYVQFGLETPDHYKITFSGAIQDEHSYPEFVETSQRNMQVLKAIVERCRTAGILDTEGIDPELQAISLWGVIHGLVSLIIQRQLPSELSRRVRPEEMVVATLRQVVRVPIEMGMVSASAKS